jgi:hypothetical protein
VTKPSARYIHRHPEAILGALPRSPLTYFREVADDLAGHIIAECEAGRQFVHVEVLTQLIGKSR